ncbi:glycosyltransferase [Microbulbifer pacificus]|uniref:glycosyltransferase n=1 Tax=Microbulbifer pacificus TaxID=407164 RepID=UPI000CF48DA3|nr:glycosyltransferase [Microbulbifer pacificus]
MRIVQLVPSLEGGELAQEALEFAQELARQGHESIVISAGGSLVSRLTLHNCQHHELPVDHKRFFNARLHGKLRRLLETLHVDILLARDALCSWHGWKVWQSMPEVTRPRFVTVLHTLPAGGLLRGRTSTALVRGELVLASSQALARDLRQRHGAVFDTLHTTSVGDGAAENPGLRVHYRGVNIRELDRRAPVSGHWHQKLLNQFPQLEGRNWLLLPAPIAPGNGQERFLELLAALKQVRPDAFGLIVGEVAAGHEKFARNLEHRAEAMGLAEHVLFLGARRDMRELYASARVTLDLADNPAATGRIVTESLAMGCPAVALAGTGVELLQQCFPQGVLPDCGSKNGAAQLAQLTDTCMSILDNPLNVNFTGFSLAETTAQAVSWFRLLREERVANDGPDVVETA